MKLAAKTTIAALVAAGGVALAASSASAEIACNASGECWHIRQHYNYKPEFGVVLHPDNWRWRAEEHYKWREHRGRGYWRDGVWIRF